MAVKEEIGNGIWRKVGNGRSINIWEDAWVPDNPGGKITSSKSLGCELSKVEELISNFRWNYPLIFRTFNKKDAGNILKIPVSLASREDSNFWIHSPTGQYTAKTGYEGLSRNDKKLSNKNCPEGETSAGTGIEMNWRRLWKLKVKHKQKLFLWKCLNDALQVKETIFRRTGKGNLICKNCGSEAETVEHLFFQCPSAQNIWKMAPLQWDGL